MFRLQWINSARAVHYILRRIVYRPTRKMCLVAPSLGNIGQVHSVRLASRELRESAVGHHGLLLLTFAHFISPFLLFSSFILDISIFHTGISA